ncbi:DUF1972 domain-containing protein [Myceligenerans xiligouense]|uniref:Glycosyltransferase involved in cell wall biosynthesis n=1 Tax=Myceligenerans xiligouense TaxID=253184 RepID=A0A3N4ZA83_9MICO|nr:DUF1972 domain-containing protein [Myceligenerans xiligouense]RPF22768.1 glycosyltransferase involved in cell wall biosynthesis [Myceligenerans xiligouense]
MSTHPLRIAMIGTRGVPARYGGFETAVEEIGARLADRGHQVRVYCRRPADQAVDDPPEYLGMERVVLPAMRRRSLETLSHTALSVAHLVAHRTDAAIVFNAANAPLLPVLRAARVPVATHVDGLEWRRAKWGRVGKRYYREMETASVRLSDALIADAQGIADYYATQYDVGSRLLTYGAPDLSAAGSDRLAELDLTPGGYHLVVARFEPENHVDVIVEGYAANDAGLPLVVVGSAPYSEEYTRRVHELADGDPRVRLLGGVWDQELLDQLYANAFTYLHGHSVGGTNPSLLRAIGGGTSTIAYDVPFNREVLQEAGRYFRTPVDLAEQVLTAEANPQDTETRAGTLARRAKDYDWDVVVDGYEQLARDLAARNTPGPRPFARRRRRRVVRP